MQDNFAKNTITPILLIFIMVIGYAFIPTNLPRFSVFNLNDQFKIENTQFNPQIPSPTFNHQSAYIKSELKLELKTELNSGLEVYYTTDGSNPLLFGKKWNKSLVVDENIEIIPFDLPYITSPHWRAPLAAKSSIVIRSIISNKDTREYGSETILHFYFPNEHESNLPIVSLLMDPKDLFGFNDGIYHEGAAATSDRGSWKKWWYLPANYQGRGKKWERNVHASFFGFSEAEFVSNAKLRISGNATRSFPQKSLRIDFSEKTGHTFLNLPFFQSKDDRAYSLVLKNAGNDWAKSFMRDVIAQKICAEIPNLKVQEARLVSVYMNGVYWGLSYLMNRYDKSYYSYKYDMSEDSVRLVDFTEWPEINHKIEFKELAQLEKVLKDEGVSNEVKFKEVNRVVDVDNFTKYICAEIFFANADWPYNNNKCFKIESKTKWAWILNDLDVGLGYYGSDKEAKQDMIAKLDSSRSLTAIIFNSLYKNESYKKQFSIAFSKLLASTFSLPRAKMKVDSLRTLLQPHMSSQIRRWRSHESVQSWSNQCDILIDFFEKRHKYLNERLR